MMKLILLLIIFSKRVKKFGNIFDYLEIKNRSNIEALREILFFCWWIR